MNHLSKTLLSSIPRALTARAAVPASRILLPQSTAVRHASTEEREPTFMEYIKTFPQFKKFRSWYVEKTGYRQLGLLYDDLKAEDFPEVALAVTRLSEKEANARIFRIQRAADLTSKQQILPKEYWTTDEEDVRYLTPYIEQVVLENKEKKLLDEV